MQMLELLATHDASAEFGVSAFVLDFAEAFWQMPLHPEERKFFCAKLDVDGKTQYLVFKRMVQGSRCAPFCWARLAALLMRLTRSLFAADKARTLCYVDDPLMLFSGTIAERRDMAAVTILTWEALGFGLQIRKGQFGAAVEWIGGAFLITPTGVTARIMDAIITDITMILDEFMRVGTVTKKQLLSFTGKANHAAGLLFALRPFLQQLYAAIHSPTNKEGLNGRIWVKHFRHTLTWLSAFIRGDEPGLVRQFDVAEYLNGGAQLEVGTDASPLGLGGWLAVNGKIAKFFSSPLTAEDSRLYGHELGSRVGQQTWECLAILVALRLCPRTHRKQSLLEIALLASRAAFPPAVTHTPGIAHKVADLLRRKLELGTSLIDLHPALAQAEESKAPVRHRSWYRALDDHV